MKKAASQQSMLRPGFNSVSTAAFRISSAARRNVISWGVAVVLALCLTVLGALLPHLRFAGAAHATANGIASAPDRGADPTQQKFERYLARAQPLLERYGYGVIAAAVMAEGLGIPTPGQTLLMAGALEAAKGRINIAWLLFLVTAAATVGNSIGYAIGRWGGRAVLNKLKVNTARQQRLDDIFKRRGGGVILLARFVDGLRQLNGIIAGIMHMPWWTFTVYNAAGALLWTCAWGLGTYYLGRDIHVIAAFLHRHGRLLYVLSATAFVALMLYLLRFRIVNR
ncbi:MAG TPA: DedA family protein [Candidatus Binatia bacterium]